MKTFPSLLRPALAAMALFVPSAALAGTKVTVVPYAPLYDSIPRATGERFSGYLLDSLRNNDQVEVVELPGETEGGAAAGGVSKKAATVEQRTAVAGALEDVQKGKALLKKRNVKPALDAFARAIDALEKNGPAVEDVTLLVDAHMKKAVCLYFMGREDEASKVNLPTALRLKPDLVLKVGSGEDEYGPPFVKRFEEVRKTLQAAGYGELRVDTAPPNAKIWLDNRETPPSPVVIHGVIPGIHYVTIKLPATDPYVEVIEVKKGALAKISPDEGPAKSEGPVGTLIATLGKNKLDTGVTGQLKGLAAKSGAEIVVFGGAFAQGKDMGIVTFLYSTKKSGIVELSKVTTDRDLLGVTVDINNLANQINDRLKSMGEPVALPRAVAEKAKPGEEEVNEVDFGPLLLASAVGEKKDAPKPPPDRTRVRGPIVAPGGGGVKPDESSAAPVPVPADAAAAGAVAAGAGAEGAAASATGRSSRVVVAQNAAPVPPPAAAPAPTPAAPAPAAEAVPDDGLGDLGLEEEKPAETVDPDAAKKAKLAKISGTSIDEEIREQQAFGKVEEAPKTEKKGLTSNWWFWPAVGVLAAGAVTTGVLVAGGSTEEGAKPVFKY